MNDDCAHAKRILRLGQKRCKSPYYLRSAISIVWHSGGVLKTIDCAPSLSFVFVSRTTRMFFPLLATCSISQDSRREVLHMAPPSNIQWQLDHIDDDRSSAIVISHVTVLPLAVIAVILRFASRHICKASIKADDYLIIVALVPNSLGNLEAWFSSAVDVV